MLNVIHVLELLGSDTKSNIQTILSESNLNEVEKLAVLSGDIELLQKLYHTLPEITCFGIAPAEPDVPPKEDEDEEKKTSNIKKIA